MMKSMQDAVNLEAHRRKKLQTALGGSFNNEKDADEVNEINY